MPTSSTPPKGSKGFANSMLKTLGLPAFKLPSRNWMLFWTVLTASLSGVAYDKYEQRKIIDYYTGKVKPLSQKPLDTNKLPRKITVFIAPPPNDYLDSSMKIWRRYVKPILHYSGVDYELIEEENQGVIRTTVANHLRALRKELQSSNNEEDTILFDEKSAQPVSTDNGQEFKRRFDYRDVMGIFHTHQKPKEIISEDSSISDSKLSGGVICLGRGAYKEYITGLHEGLLGPLEAPVEEQLSSTVMEGTALTGPLRSSNDQENILEADTLTIADSAVDNMTAEDKLVGTNISGEATIKEEVDEKTAEQNSKVLKPFISPSEYGAAEFPFPELEMHNTNIRETKNAVPILLHQPVLMIPTPNLLGFLTIPQRIIRFYERRKYCAFVCSQTYGMVKQDTIRPFADPQDLDLGKEEEEDWPRTWVKQGLERKSEWTRELQSDKRVTKFMYIYDRKDNEYDNSK
ncbi:hypothetical protein KAFR_0A00820 [Kazachstania africana CBS 2517]|uniref:Mitochondrial import inner membrane translocase subunit TIM54 n=1 Tax=Kazachstania africana (strain ATCC 22294 / BCRC 22015 / CBS 2517 / CECT 1963 / NBRC 1671 / NRRL Y-8276) TaxID=1071382 RepID=H2AMC0_KAZAF|nr:hypothetical protein KAFR_0A00820 [Kazachstania africana CBS 2517]CCF55520.1 hypothetical protein KAFR_0A00820 [Kazachstania africana CBS 2517]